MFDVNAAFQRAPKITDRAVDQAAVLVNGEEQRYFGVNRVGARIWELLERPQRIVDLVAVLTSEFAVAEGECRRQTEAFLREMFTRKLVLQHAPARG